MKKVLSILLIGIVVIGLTGCGNNDQQISVARIEERLTQNISSARIIACGNKSFSKNVDLTQTTYQKRLDGYDGSIISNSTKITKDSDINYCLVMATNARGYLNITVNYEKIDDDTYKPTFSIPELLNE